MTMARRVGIVMLSYTVALHIVAASANAPLAEIGKNGVAFPLQADRMLVQKAIDNLDLDEAARRGIGGAGLVDLHLTTQPNGSSLMDLGTSAVFRQAASSALYDLRALPNEHSDIALVGTDIFCKPPGMQKGFVGWHQDQSWWLVKPEIASIWVSLDDSNTESACVRYVLGSHSVQQIFNHTSHVEDNMLKWSIDVAKDKEDSAVCAILKQSEFAVFSGFVVHSSPANVGALRRCGVVFRYTPWPAELASSYELNGKPYVPRPQRLSVLAQPTLEL
eukprot:TRINITY_DN3483_c0_g1_i1.p1 TRINITY_DN3483_c0_g1~~TRINITY_DN3483_c0_g1_i1.p1  ORF type:complete len:276 (-),score=25.82 TRINITY_DN3483_c0_g1_i1:455-1282(-)